MKGPLYAGMHYAGGPAGLTRDIDPDEEETYPVVVTNPVTGWAQWSETSDPEFVEDYNDWDQEEPPA